MTFESLLASYGGWWPYLLIGAVACFASLWPVGWFVPEQTLAIVGGAMATLGLLSFSGVVASVAGGAFLGCVGGYWAGHYFALSRNGWKPKKRLGWWLYARCFLHRRLFFAVILGRFSSPTRSCLPNAAGIATVPVGRFTAYSAIACLGWAFSVCGAGAMVGSSTTVARSLMGMISLVVLSVISFTVVAGYRRWRRTGGYEREYRKVYGQEKELK